MGANELLGKPMDTNALLKLAAKIEGHPDNVAPALLGGLVVSIHAESEIITRRYEVPALTIVIVKPECAGRLTRPFGPAEIYFASRCDFQHRADGARD
jgi:homoserine kinase